MATNRVFEHGKLLSVAVASTVESGDIVAVGGMVGVAQTDYDSNTGKATLDFGGVYDLSVKGVNGAGNVAVALGDAIYLVSGDTPVLSKKASGVFVGYALEAVDSGATATIQVRLAGGASGGGIGSSGQMVSISAEITANGSAQNYAHGLGTVPSHVVVVPTEFASNSAFDVAEGSHTTTNAIVTVTSGVKYKVMAFK